MADGSSISRQEFQALREEVTEVRTAVLGIDGKSGVLSALGELKGDVKDLTKTVNEMASSINSFKDAQINNHKLFATKAEVNNIEYALLASLNDLDKKRDEIRKSDKLIEEEKRNKLEGFKLSKVAIVVSVTGILFTTILNLIKLWF